MLTDDLLEKIFFVVHCISFVVQVFEYLYVAQKMLITRTVSDSLLVFVLLFFNSINRF